MRLRRKAREVMKKHVPSNRMELTSGTSDNCWVKLEFDALPPFACTDTSLNTSTKLVNWVNFISKNTGGGLETLRLTVWTPPQLVPAFGVPKSPPTHPTSVIESAPPFGPPA